MDTKRRPGIPPRQKSKASYRNREKKPKTMITAPNDRRAFLPRRDGTASTRQKMRNEDASGGLQHTEHNTKSSSSFSRDAQQETERSDTVHTICIESGRKSTQQTIPHRNRTRGQDERARIMRTRQSTGHKERNDTTHRMCKLRKNETGGNKRSETRFSDSERHGDTMNALETMRQPRQRISGGNMETRELA